MRANVEWGVPAPYTKSGVEGLTGQFTTPSAYKARLLASDIFYVHTQEYHPPFAWSVSRRKPRATLWASDRSFWVTVSVLD